MVANRPPDSEAPRQPSSDRFWPRFWYNVCKHSEEYFMLLNVITVLAVLNAIAMLIGPQSTGAFIVSVMVFGFLGITGLGVGLVLYQCKQLRAPNADDSDD